MRLTQFEADGFKNLRQVVFTPHPSYNLILGKNAQGKTNLLEAIWALTGCRSFRGTKERDYLSFDGGILQVAARLKDARREQSLKLCMTPGSVPEKKFWHNDIPQKGSQLFSVLHCVAFTPDDLALITGGPERRRSFLDLCSAQLYAPMLPLVRRYQLVLQQRNSLLKQKLPPEQITAMLPMWDKQLITLGTEISVRRAAYVRKLAEACVPLYAKISGGREQVQLHYHASVYGKDAQNTLPDVPEPSLVETYQQRLEQGRESDLFLGHTGVGIHRDDLEVTIDGRSAKEFGSQGQKKSLALALKLAQAQIYSQRQKESPIVLLDDVMGELDETRQAVVSTIVQDMQVFVTACHPEAVRLPAEGSQFWMELGNFTQMK